VRGSHQKPGFLSKIAASFQTIDRLFSSSFIYVESQPEYPQEENNKKSASVMPYLF
jgi:hypothetical protein